MANQLINKNPAEQLNGFFQKATIEQYWHHLMRCKTSASAYQGAAIEQRIRQITAKNGSNSFMSTSVHGWTPAHVAVLSNNEAGLEFLKQRDALAHDVKDEEGNTPADLARKFCPGLLHHFKEKDQPKNPTWTALSNGFCEGLSKIPPPKEGFTYARHSDDFGIVIKRLLFAKPNDNSEAFRESYRNSGLKIDHFAKNMVSHAERFGFDVDFSTHQYALRDNLIRLPGGDVVTIANSENTPLALERSSSRALHSRDTAAFQTDHLFFKGRLGSAHAQTDKAAADLIGVFGCEKEAIPSMRFYMEGGNHYVMTNSSGKKILLLGEDTLYTGLNQMRRDGAFKDPDLDMSAIIAFYKAKLSANPELLMKTLNEMYSQGLLAPSPGKEKGLISQEEMVEIIQTCDVQRESAYPTTGNPYLDLAEEKQLYSPLNLNASQKKQGIEIAANYLSQKDYTKSIIAMTFSIDQEDVVFIPQMDYHLDVFLRPGPEGSIFVQDYALCVKLLSQIESQSDQLGLTSRDNEILKRYLDTAEKLERELGPLCAKVKEKLSRAGLHVIPTPGIFYDVSPDLLNPQSPDEAITFNLNFLNALTGWSPQTSSYYYLTTGAEAGDRLGELLMHAFEQFLQRYQPNVQVGFSGYDPDNTRDFSEGMRWLNRRGSQLGLHCLSFALETAPHVDNL